FRGLLSNGPVFCNVPISTVGSLASPYRMTRLPRCFWLALASLILAGLNSSTVQASCGHYVLIGTPRQDNSAQAGKQARPDMPSGAAQHSMPVPSSPTPKPCSGPGCSRGDSPLLPLPTTTPSAEEERWGHEALGSQTTEVPTDFLPLSL